MSEDFSSAAKRGVSMLEGFLAFAPLSHLRTILIIAPPPLTSTQTPSLLLWLFQACHKVIHSFVLDWPLRKTWKKWLFALLLLLGLATTTTAYYLELSLVHKQNKWTCVLILGQLSLKLHIFWLTSLH